MILYFSGTGNTKYCAEYLGKKLGDVVVDMAKYIRARKAVRFSGKKPYIICAPIYCGTLPLPVFNFIKRSVFRGSDRFYFLTTYGGSAERGGDSSPMLSRQLAEKKKKKYYGSCHVEMPMNMISMFSLQSDEEIKRRFDEMDGVLDDFAEKVAAGEVVEDFRHSRLGAWFITKSVNLCYYVAISDRKFYPTDKCIGCGICEKVCPLGNITMKDGRPVWNGHCTQCMACICRCPREAIEYGSHTIGNPRYTFEKFSERLREK